MMRRPGWCRWLRTALLAAVVLLPRRGYADDADSKAEALIQRGIELRRSRRNGEALAQFQGAYSLVPTPRAQAQIALALQALGDWLGAERGLEEALRASGDPWIAQYRGELDGALATVRAHLARLYVEVDVTEGQLLLDGVSVHALPSVDAIRVRAGALDIEVRAPGHAPARRKVEIAAGADLHERFSLEPLVAPQPPPSTSAASGSPARRSQPRSPLGAYLAFGGSVALAAGGVVAWRVREHDLAIYDDDSRCRVGPLTRAQQCGGYADTANLALYLEIGAFAASALAAGVGAWLWWAPPQHSPVTAAAWCGPFGPIGLSCSGRY
jgi:hypothetical protein